MSTTRNHILIFILMSRNPMLQCYTTLVTQLFAYHDTLISTINTLVKAKLDNFFARQCDFFSASYANLLFMYGDTIWQTNLVFIMLVSISLYDAIFNSASKAWTEFDCPSEGWEVPCFSENIISNTVAAQNLPHTHSVAPWHKKMHTVQFCHEIKYLQ